MTRATASRAITIAGAIVVAIVLLAYAGAYLTAEPLRRYVEREVNRRLVGYSVGIRGLSLHPLSVSFDLVDTTIVQSANPTSPVLRVQRIRATLHWRALLDGRVVADITFDRPEVNLDLSHVRTEATSDVALKDRGWQRALEAVALDLKINRLRVLGGDVTYVDAGPFKPLKLSRVNARVENIRNIRSKDRVYPSDLHLEGQVFEAGRLRLDGHADFLAEPHPGIRARFELERVDLDYFRPITNRVNLSVRGGTLAASGSTEYAPAIRTLTLDRVVLQGPEVEYVHTAQTAEAEGERAGRAARAARAVANAPDVQLRIDRLDLVKGRIGFVNRAARPAYRVRLTDVDLSVDNLSNQRAEGTAAIRLAGKLMGSGATRASATFRPATRSADLDLRIQMEDTDMTRMNDLVRAYGGFDVAAGRLSVYAELRATGGAITGYIKPMFRGLQVPGRRPDEAVALGRRFYEGLVIVATKLLENRSRGEIATVVTVSGRVDQPQISTWQVVRRLLQNAFLRAILPGFERGRP